MKLSNLNKFLILGMFSLSMQVVSAHGVWVAQRADQDTIVYGHGSSDNAYEAEKVKLVVGFDVKNSKINIEQKTTENNVVLDIPEQTVYVGILLDNGYWSQDANGEWKNIPKDAVDGAKQGGHYVKNAIAVIRAEGDIKPVKGLKLQIIPATNPLTKKAGDELDVQVLFEGKALAQTEIVTDYVNMSHIHEVKTDNEGKATVIIRNQGLNVLSVNYTEELKNDPKADKNGYNATLSFSFQHEH